MMSLAVTVPPGLLIRTTIATTSSSSDAASSSASTRATVPSSRRRPKLSPRSSLVMTPEMPINNTFLSPEPLITTSSSGCGRCENGLKSPVMKTQPLAANASNARQTEIGRRLGIGGRRLYSWASERGKMRLGVRARRAAIVAVGVIVACANAPAAQAADATVRIDKEDVASYKTLLREPNYDVDADERFVTP